MKRTSSIILVTSLYLLFPVSNFQYANAGVFKWIRVGKYQNPIVDQGDQGEGTTGWKSIGWYDYTYFSRPMYGNIATHIGCRDWTDEHGNKFPFKTTGQGMWASDENTVIMPVADAEGRAIRRYFRYQPPSVTVDGFLLSDPFPFDEMDEVNPDKIPGTADVMVESWFNTDMGVTVHQRVLGWNQKNHDDYLIYDWTFTNTGNVDLDDDIELPDQILKDVYFARYLRVVNWPKRMSYSAYGQYPGDSLRITYGYPSRQSGADEDIFGGVDGETGFLRNPKYVGEVFVHVDKSVDDNSDDPAQPQATGVCQRNIDWGTLDPGVMGAANDALAFETMRDGLFHYNSEPYLDEALVYSNTNHETPWDQMGYQYTKDPAWAFGGKMISFTSTGPYTLNPGESFRIVRAMVVGSISPELGWEVGSAWKNGTATWDGPDDLATYYPVWANYPDLAPTPNDQAKDRWVCTGKDSLFANAGAAQWNVQKGYDIPVAPPPPSVEIRSLPDRISITWGDESEAAPDFAGYRVYRAVGTVDFQVEADVVTGVYAPIFECGAGTGNAITNSYDDTDAGRGKAYFYYVTAFDDGEQNDIGVKGVRESLESGKYLTLATKAAYLTREPGKSLSDVRIVPNPFNIGARDLQYIGEPDKIMFMDLPPVCTIKIFTQSGDLVKTIEHTDGSGDEPWGVVTEEHSATDTGQIIVSGIYIAYIETPDGESTVQKFVVVR